MGLSCGKEIVITRACIGHTYFTQSYLLKGDEMPWCIPCHCPDTVKHILLDCIDLCDTRINCYRNVNTMQKLFCDLDLDLFVAFTSRTTARVILRRVVYGGGNQCTLHCKPPGIGK